MKFLKMLGVAAVAAAALRAFAGSASATTLTSPSGTQYGGTIATELKEGEAVLKSSFIGEVKCAKSTVEGNVESQGAEVTVKGSITTLDFTECNGTVTVVKNGTLEAHTDSASADGNGILTSNGAEVTVELAGLHCIYSTSNTNLGTVTGGSPAVFQAKSAAIPRTGGRSGAFCGSSATWTATYKVTTPSTLLID
ncbi:MAG TPA: hypothetical protein VGI73_13930 [Solirubrobacterales bacterium]